jgi:hypothetical protein
MTPKTLARRRVLAGAGGVAIALPFLEALAPRRARAQTAKKRLVVFFTPEGTQAKNFYPTGSETDFTFGSISSALAPLRGDLLVFQGVDHTSCKDVGSDHFKSMVHMLTGGSPDSVDQIIASRIGKSWRFASLEVGVRPRNVNEKGITAYSGGKMVPPEYNPIKVFARLFTGGAAPAAGATGGTPPELDRIFARRKSVVDFVKDQFEATKRLVSAPDRLRLEEHVGAIRDVEKSLTTPPEAVTPECGNPKVALVEGSNTGGPLPELVKVQTDLVVLAVACQLTPVITLQIGNSGFNDGFGFLGIPPASDGLHGWVHNDKGNPLFPGYAQKTFTYFAERFADLVTRLKSLDEGGRTILDSSLVVWATHFGHGGGHGPTNVPWVLAGRAGGAVRPGRYLNFASQPQPHNRLLLGIAQAMDVRLDAIGNPKYGTSPLPGMV